MNPGNPTARVTELLNDWRAGNRAALDTLTPIVTVNFESSRRFTWATSGPITVEETGPQP